MSHRISLRLLRSPAFWVVLIAVITALTANVSSPFGMTSRSSIMAEDRPSLAKMASESTLLREGAIFSEVKGRFRKEGDRFLFMDETNERRYKCLENACLQRVASAMQGEDRKLVWLVSARITEFNDENFLLLEKAVRSK